MPLYHYECRACGHEMELRQGFGDPAPECPVCSAVMHRRIFPVGIVFKGSGFYSTDYRSGGSGGDGSAKGAAKETAKEAAEETGGKKEAGSGSSD